MVYESIKACRDYLFSSIFLIDYNIKVKFRIIIRGKNFSRFAGGVSLAVLFYFRHSSHCNKLFLNGYHSSHQTLLKRAGGCITFTNFKHHSKVKALGTYLNWSKVPLGGEEVHILNVYLEPGQEGFVVKRAETVVSLVKSIIR